MLLLGTALSPLVAANTPAFEPARIPFTSLDSSRTFEASGRLALKDALKTGLFQLTDIPGYAAARKSVLTLADECAGWTQSHTFDDGTTRRTIASYTIPGPGGIQSFQLPESERCAEFDRAAKPFRMLVDDAVRLFGKRLGSMLGDASPLLSTEDGFTFAGLDEVVDSGEHLEHIHSYSRPAAAAEAGKKEKTLELHTDQGLFIAFTPAMLRTSGGTSVPAADTPLDKESAFLVSLPDGSQVRASFDADALVFMLGDGIHQILTPKLAAGSFSPRPVPHALSVAPTAAGQARLWYGRMVLPPSDAVVEGTGLTFGEMRDKMNAEIAASSPASENSAVSLGCASTRSAASRSLSALHRQLLAEPASCMTTEADARRGYAPNMTGLQCWYRCMPLELGNNEKDSPYSDATDCAARNLATQCINVRGQIAPRGTFGPGKGKLGWAHGDYFPACTNTTEEQTPLPTLDGFPRVGTCAAESAFGAFSEASEAEYTASADLVCTEGRNCLCPEAEDLNDEHNHGDADHGVVGAHPTSRRLAAPAPAPADTARHCVVGKFLWTLRDGAVHAKLMYNGLFGYLAFGIVNPGGGHNGMNGGRIVLALPGSPDVGDAQVGAVPHKGNGNPTVDEYIINEVGGSAFRFWNKPFAGSSLRSAGYATTDCYTSMTFTTDTIAGWALNVSGTDDMLWAFNGDDAYAGKHSERGIITIRWADGVAASPPPPSPSPSPLTASPPPSGNNNENNDSSGLDGGQVAGIAVAVAVVGILVGVIGACVILKKQAKSPSPPVFVATSSATKGDATKTEKGEIEASAMETETGRA